MIKRTAGAGGEEESIRSERQQLQSKQLQTRQEKSRTRATEKKKAGLHIGEESLTWKGDGTTCIAEKQRTRATKIMNRKTDGRT